MPRITPEEAKKIAQSYFKECLDRLTDDEIRAAQGKLNDLCEQYKLEKFNIQGAVGLVGWKKLIHAMCGLDINHRDKSGRKANSDELVDDVRRLYALHSEFSRFRTYKDEKTGKDVICGNAPDFSDTKIHELIAENLSIKYDRKIKPTKIRGILNGPHSVNQLTRLARAEIENLENDLADPDEIFSDMYKKAST